MKKFQFRLPLLAFLLAIAFSAFTSKDFESGNGLQTLHFFLVEGGEPVEYIGDFDLTDESDRLAITAATGCEDEADLCANGYLTMTPDENSIVYDSWDKSN